MTDLIARLRKYSQRLLPCAHEAADALEAKDRRIEALELELKVRLPIQEYKAHLKARIAALEAALKPIERVKGFSNMTEWIPASAVKDDETIQVQMTGAEFKAARAAYLGEKE